MKILSRNKGTDSSRGMEYKLNRMLQGKALTWEHVINTFILETGLKQWKCTDKGTFHSAIIRMQYEKIMSTGIIQDADCCPPSS